MSCSLVCISVTVFALFFKIMELITKQTGLMRDRTLLARELEFLRRNISKNNQEEASQFISSSRLLVDEVLNNIRSEEIDKQDSYITKAKLSSEDRKAL